MILTKLISDKLKLAIDKKGTATFVVSGGTSPLKLFEDLSKIDLPWNKVQITLVDDRLVNKNHIHSNQKLINDHLLKNKAKLANFIPLSEEIIKSKIIITPFDVNLLGMGEDGHFASLFPDMIKDFNLFDLSADPNILTITSHGDPFLPRITMNLSLILKSEFIVLLVKGSIKQKIIDQAKNDNSLPIHYLLKSRASNFLLEYI
ncbi:MAG: 6-phosphogluconolactonase [Candidatus Puniceispirillales bacterium]|jgi:6-phosphogluconolactonase|tara:strand:- start:1084 stop:1695 length:612 start_codon:yes stop_codon:yes gene_type:complete